MRNIPIVPLNLDLVSDEILEFQAELQSRVINQEEAVQAITDTYEHYLAGLLPPNRPIANLLFLGPTGVGKTLVCEALAEIFYGDKEAMLKLNGGEYQSAHEISKLIGAPPSYVGHGEKNSSSLLSQEKLDKHHTEKTKISIVLFDEIEKASSAFHDLLLGILDKGTLSTGKGELIDFTKAIIIMTSNVGADEINKSLGGKLGFNTSQSTRSAVVGSAKNAVAKKFSPEFVNRLDKMVVFNNLEREQLRDILHVELRNIQRRIFSSNYHCQFVLTLNKAAEDYIIDSGYDIRYGARHLKRSLDKNIVNKLSRIILTGQIEMGDVLHVDVVNGALSFHKVTAAAVLEKDNESDFFEFLDIGAPTKEDPEIEAGA